MAFVLSSAVLAFSAAPAVAQNPVNGGYGRTPIPLPSVRSGEPSSNVASSRTAASRTVSSPKRLPFTGIDVRLLILGGVGLVGAGYGLRRRTRPHIR
jgi:hypothetical protein